MAAGDLHVFKDGYSFIETELGPLVTVPCDDCRRPIAAAIEYVGPVRCSGCWRRFHGFKD